MEREVFFDGVEVLVGNVSARLSNNTFVAEGGDAEVHKLDGSQSVKLYKEPDRAKELENKLTILKEKADSFHPSVVAPQELVFKSGDNELLGFSMKFLPDAHQLSDYFWHSDRTGPQEILDQYSANLLYDIADGLKAIHRSRVVIGDLKPDNILVSKGKAYIVDFDSASLLPDYPADSYTPRYVDPRLKSDVKAEGPYAFDPESDWFALGVIAFEMFLGIQPWLGSNARLKTPLLRAFNYSVVGFDPDVTCPATMRPISWLDDKTELKKYFRHLFSHDVFARHSIDYVLEWYFPRVAKRDGLAYKPTRKPTRRVSKLPELRFDPDLEKFTGTAVRWIEEQSTIKIRTGSSEDDRNRFLDYMLEP
ncbi:MAG: protein kinase domain-containing protein [Pyrinomonadaceae bacterium]